MAKLFSLDAFRRHGDRDAAVISEREAGAPNRTISADEDDRPVVVRRAAVLGELAGLIAEVETLAYELPLLGVPTTAYTVRRQALQPAIDELRLICPPASKPYSPCAADSRASLTRRQFNDWQQLKTDLQVLAAEMASVLQRMKLGF